MKPLALFSCLHTIANMLDALLDNEWAVGAVLAVFGLLAIAATAATTSAVEPAIVAKLPHEADPTAGAPQRVIDAPVLTEQRPSRAPDRQSLSLQHTGASSRSLDSSRRSSVQSDDDAAPRADGLAPTVFICRQTDGLLLVNGGAHLDAHWQEVAIGFMSELAGSTRLSEHRVLVTKQRGPVVLHYTAANMILCIAITQSSYPAELVKLLFDDARDAFAAQASIATEGQDWARQLELAAQPPAWLDAVTEGLVLLQSTYENATAPSNLARLVSGLASPSPAAKLQRDAFFGCADVSSSSSIAARRASERSQAAHKAA
jgi:hypothetical protein